jgi:hypothetical protein
MLRITRKQAQGTVVKQLFPDYYLEKFEAQLEKIPLRFSSAVADPNSDGTVCEECAKEGKLTFTCHICQKVQPATEIHESYGCYSADHVCKTCFRTVPAEKWLATIDSLEGKHRYDYE